MRFYSSLTKRIPTTLEVAAQVSPKVREIVKGYPSLMRIDVKWGEMDAFGHLNNVHMVRYMESSRIAHADHKLRPELSEKEYSDLIMGRGIGPILKSTFINYRRVTMFPDTLVIATRIKKDSISVDRFTQECIMVSEAQEAIVAHGEAVVVCYDHSKGVKCPLPDAWLRALEN